MNEEQEQLNELWITLSAIKSRILPELQDQIEYDNEGGIVSSLGNIESLCKLMKEELEN